MKPIIDFAYSCPIYFAHFILLLCCTSKHRKLINSSEHQTELCVSLCISQKNWNITRRLLCRYMHSEYKQKRKYFHHSVVFMTASLLWCCWNEEEKKTTQLKLTRNLNVFLMLKNISTKWFATVCWCGCVCLQTCKRHFKSIHFDH